MLGETERIRDGGNLFAFLAEARLNAVDSKFGIVQLHICFGLWANLGNRNGKPLSSRASTKIHQFLRETSSKKELVMIAAKLIFYMAQC